MSDFAWHRLRGQLFLNGDLIDLAVIFLLIAPARLDPSIDFDGSYIAGDGNQQILMPLLIFSNSTAAICTVYWLELSNLNGWKWLLLCSLNSESFMATLVMTTYMYNSM